MASLDLIIDTSHKEAGTEARVELRQVAKHIDYGTVDWLLGVIEKNAPGLIQWNWWESVDPEPCGYCGDDRHHEANCPNVKL